MIESFSAPLACFSLVKAANETKTFLASPGHVDKLRHESLTHAADKSEVFPRKDSKSEIPEVLKAVETLFSSTSANLRAWEAYPAGPLFIPEGQNPQSVCFQRRRRPPGLGLPHAPTPREKANGTAHVLRSPAARRRHRLESRVRHRGLGIGTRSAPPINGEQVPKRQ